MSMQGVDPFTQAFANLPNEIKDQIYLILSPKDLGSLSSVSKLWKEIVRDELLQYKKEIIELNLKLFVDMSRFMAKSDNADLVNLINEKIKTNEIFSEDISHKAIGEKVAEYKDNRMNSRNPKEKSRISKIKASVTKKIGRNKAKKAEAKSTETKDYLKLVKAMVEIELAQKNTLLFLKYPKINRYQEHAEKNLAFFTPKVFYITNLCMYALPQTEKATEAVLSRTAAKNEDALKRLVGLSNLLTLKLSRVCEVEKDDVDESAIGKLSALINTLENLTTIEIDEFQMNDNDAIDLSHLIRSKETLTTCTIRGEGNMTDDGLFAIAQVLNERNNPKFKFTFEYHSDDRIQRGLNELRSLGRDNIILQEIV